jgi:hypothetical protein
MKHRDKISEILEKKQRLTPTTHRYEQFLGRIYPLVSGFRTLLATRDIKPAFPEEWFKYYPIGYIAALEGYLRLLIGDIIDSGSPYTENILGFKDIRFDISTVIAIHSKKVSLGEFVAHLLSFNNIEDINSNLSILMGFDFLDELKNRQLPSSSETIIQAFPDIIKNIIGAIELRHMYCHELATGVKVEPMELEKLVGSVALFAMLIEEIVAEKVPGMEKSGTLQKIGLPSKSKPKTTK